MSGLADTTEGSPVADHSLAGGDADRHPRWFVATVLVIAGLGLLLRLLSGVATYKDLELGLDDNFFYHRQAWLVADGHGFANPWIYYEEELAEKAYRKEAARAGNTFNQAELDQVLAQFPGGNRVEPSAAHVPVYTLYLAGWTKLGVRSPLGHRIVTTFLTTAAVVVLALLARRLANEWAGVAVAGFGAAYPSMWINDGLILSESAAVLMIAVTLSVAYRVVRQPSAANAALFGLALGLLALTRSEALMLFGLLVVPVMLTRTQLPFGRRVGLVVLTGIIGLGVMAPWLARNMTGFREPVLLVAGSGFVLEIANCDETYNGRLLGYWSDTCGANIGTWPEGADIDESVVDVAKREAGMTYIREHLAEQPKVIGARLGRVYGFYRITETKNLDIFFERRDRTHLLWNQWFFYPMMALAPFGLLALRRNGRSVIPPVVIIGLAIFTVAVAIGIPRYRVSFDVVLSLLAGLGLAYLLGAARNRRPGAHAPAINTGGVETQHG